VPRSDLYIALRYGQDLGWYAAATSQYVSTVAVNDSNAAGPPSSQTLAPAYLIAGLVGGYVAELHRVHLDGFLRFNNLFNRDYVGSVIVDDGNSRFFEPGPGFAVLAGVRASFQ
jgi:iron complex outermembrane receptor protein